VGQNAFEHWAMVALTLNLDLPQ